MGPRTKSRPRSRGRQPEVQAQSVVAMRHLRAQLGGVRAEPDVRTRLPTMRCGTSSARPAPGPLRPVAGGTPPQPGRRAASDPQRGARPRAARRAVQPQGVVAMQHLRPRMEGHRLKPHVRRHRLPSLRTRTPRQDTEQGRSGTIARRQAPRDRCPTTSVSQPGNRSRPARRAVEPEAVVAVRHLRTRVEDRRVDSHGRLRMPRLLSSEAPRACASRRSMIRFGQPTPND